MNWILRLKHWKAFIILLAATVINNLSIDFIPGAAGALPLVGGITCFLFWLAVGHQLYQLLPSKINLNYNFFVVNAFIWLIAYAAIYILSDGQGMTFTGLDVLGFSMSFSRLFIFYSFPSGF